jgi:hypothetical protein
LFRQVKGVAHTTFPVSHGDGDLGYIERKMTPGKCIRNSVSIAKFWRSRVKESSLGGSDEAQESGNV